MALASIAFSIGAFSIAAILSGMFLLGKDKGKGSEKTLGVINVFVGLAIGISSLLLLLTTPFGTTSPATNVELMFSLLQLIFAFVWATFGFALLNGWDMKFIGSMTLVLFIYNLITFLLVPALWSGAFTAAGLVIVELTLLSYLADEVGFWAVTHGKMKGAPQGWILIISGFLSIILAVVVGGILPL